jgi:Kdo2-lipid IVA lauroyltransferase/acyltransferase
MFYLIYGLLYLVSLLPFRILYLLSDLLYGLTYYIIGYRKAVVFNNLEIAFPDKSKEERGLIAKRFYRNLVDDIVETIKLLSISERELKKRCSSNFEVINAIAAKGKNIQLQPGHQFNVEFFNLLYSKELKNLKFIFMYMPFSDKAFDRVFNKLRTRFGSILVSATNFKNERSKLNGQYAITLGADQNPGNLHTAFWMNFFNKAVPFIPGPARQAVKNNSAIVLVEFVRVKRGYYKFENILLTENAGDFTAEELTKKYRDFVEAAVRRQPANYLWTHRRWKHSFREEFATLWIES